jgi:hypothetical protein
MWFQCASEADNTSLNADEDPRFFNKTVTGNGLVCFEPTRFKGCFLAFDGTTLKLKRTQRPEQDDEVHFVLKPVDGSRTTYTY